MFSFIKNIFKETLHKACKKGDIEAVKQHLATGADVNAGGVFGTTTPLYLAAGEGHKEIVELLIAKGANVNTKTDEGSTPLHSATANEHENIAELLIEKGADVNAKDNKGRTALHCAT